MSSGMDIEAVINHVHKTIPLEQQHRGTSHTVMQLTMSSHVAQQAAALAKNSSAGHGNGSSKPSPTAAPFADPAGVGRITFLLLSNVCQVLSLSG